MPKAKLNPKQERFCQEYIIDLNGTQAAIRAGYSKKTAAVQATQHLIKLNIQERVQELQKKIGDKLEINAEWVRKRFFDISNRCMTVEPVMVYDASSKEMIQMTTINDKGEEVGVFKFDSSGANKATEMIGKHLGFFEVDNKQKTPDAPDEFTLNVVRKKK